MKVTRDGEFAALCTVLGVGTLALEAYTEPSLLSFAGVVLLIGAIWFATNLAGSVQRALQEVEDKKKA